MLPAPAPLNHSRATITLADLEPIMADWADHVGREAPREACGVVIKLPEGILVYIPSPNLAQGEAGCDRFMLDPAVMAAAQDVGELVAVLHSHPHADANPSEADLVMCNETGVSWAIMGWPSEVVKLAHPGYIAPLEGRSFSHGILDCYTLIQDYYQRILGLSLPRFERPDDWWEPKPDRPALNLYRDHFAEAGFVQINGQPRLHDGLLMQVRANVENHAAVYLGEGKMLHHLYGRPSTKDVWGGYWQRHTTAVLRHRSLLQDGDTLMPQGLAA
jgi:cell wall-associated NlpC family hydrolase